MLSRSPSEKKTQSGWRRGVWESTYSLNPGNQSEPDTLAARENTSVR